MFKNMIDIHVYIYYTINILNMVKFTIIVADKYIHIIIQGVPDHMFKSLLPLGPPP